MEIAAIAALVKIGETLWNFIEKLKSADDAKRTRVAEYLDKIAACIRRISNQFDLGEKLTDDCVMLEIYARDLNDVLREILDTPTINDLTQAVKTATDARALAYAMEGVEEPEPIYEALDTAAGHFGGIADRLRV